LKEEALRTSSVPDRYPRQEVLSVLRPIFSTFRYRLLLGFAALLGVDLLQLLIPLLLKSAVDGLAAGAVTQGHLLRIGFFITLAAAAAAVLRFSWRYLIIGFSRLLERDVRNRIYAHILRLDRPFFEKHTTGDIMAHVSNDLQAVQMACGIGLVSAVDALVMSTAAIAFMIHIHGPLTLLALLPMPLLAIATRVLTGRLHHRFNIVQEHFSLLTEFVRSCLVSMRLVKAYTMENLQKKEFEKLGRQYVDNNIKVAVIQGLLVPISTLVGNFGMMLVLYFGGRFAIEGRISLGDFVAFVSYLYMLVWPMMALGWVANLAQRGITSLRRIHILLSSLPELPSDEGKEHISAPEPSFSLRGLTFAYRDSATPALRNVSLELTPGIYGLTGRTGCGKSTLCKLLARLYPVRDGSLFFGSQDVNTLSIEDVRRRIAYVSQEAVLFSETVAANIAYGKPGASPEEIAAAARAAAVHDEIMEFADGYDTLVGERGVTLSGGQRQRLALARALISNRPVLVVDDALAALDVETEHRVLGSIGLTECRKLILIVSQRVKLLSDTDEIIILEEGAVLDRGRHDELLSRNSLYRAMHEKQSRGRGKPRAETIVSAGEKSGGEG
jgi:ATP-binding cassette, subfamily B, multidrug efflux pump